MDIGGFVMGMDGEDADLTMQFGRLSYRAVLDPIMLASRHRSLLPRPATPWPWW
ncbi:MAG: hypothetical protein QOH66_376 [Actinomycetota bacterium]|jgi:hypothetical protein|nr:hypothetical protein [Actinomycetota bacterium]